MNRLPSVYRCSDITTNAGKGTPHMYIYLICSYLEIRPCLRLYYPGTGATEKIKFLSYYQEETFFGVETCLSNSSSRCTVSGFPRNSEKDLSNLIRCMTAKTSSVVTPCFMSYSICLAQLEIVLYFLKLRFSKDDASGDMPLI